MSAKVTERVFEGVVYSHAAQLTRHVSLIFSNPSFKSQLAYGCDSSLVSVYQTQPTIVPCFSLRICRSDAKSGAQNMQRKHGCAIRRPAASSLLSPPSQFQVRRSARFVLVLCQDGAELKMATNEYPLALHLSIREPPPHALLCRGVRAEKA